MIYQIYDVTMKQYIKQSSFLNVYFEPLLIKSPNLANW